MESVKENKRLTLKELPSWFAGRSDALRILLRLGHPPLKSVLAGPWVGMFYTVGSSEPFFHSYPTYEHLKEAALHAWRINNDPDCRSSDPWSLAWAYNVKQNQYYTIDFEVKIAEVTKEKTEWKR